MHDNVLNNLKGLCETKAKAGCRIAVLLVGSNAGDDAAGILLYRQLKGRVKNLKLFFCGTTPEVFIHRLRDFKPDILLVIDAVDRGLEPGRILVENLLDECPKPLLTHKFPLAVVARILAEELSSCDFWLIGIQASKLNGEPSRPVKGAVKDLTKFLLELDKINKSNLGMKT